MKIYLPRLAGDAAGRSRGPCRPPGRAWRAARPSCVVEDHEDLRAYSAGVLRELGYRVLDAANGA